MNEMVVLNNPKAEQQILITDKAAAEILRIRSENQIPATAGLRVGLKGGGCSGFTYVLGFDEQSREGDVRLESNGVVVFSDSKSLVYLSGTELDFSDGLNGRGFVFNNPHAVKTCGCGNSFGV